MESTEIDVDVELFIDEIRQHPEIWDMRREEYKDRVKKATAWEDVCKHMIADFETKSEDEKNSILKKLALKWKNLKDNFSRNLRKRSKSGQPVGAGRKYIYEKHLSFLQQTMALAMTQSSSAEEPSLDSPISQGSHHEEADTVLSSAPQVPPGPSNKSRQRQELESSLITFMNAPVVVEPPDQHRSFFESMVPLIQNFSEQQTLQFRAGVIDLIMQIKRQPAETQSAVLSPPQSSVFNRSMPQNYYPIPQHNFQQYSQPINFPSPHPMTPACPTPDHSIVAGSNISSTPSQTSPSSEYAFGDQM